jgi:hypothetical protein
MRRTLLVLLMALLAQICFSQEAAKSARGERLLLVALAVSPGSGYSARDAVVLQKSLALTLAEKVRQVRVIEYGQAGFPSSIESRNGKAAGVGANCWVWVGISGTRGAPTIRAQSYDLLTNAMVIDQSFARAQELFSVSAPPERWDEIVSRVAATYLPEGVSEQPRNERRTVKLVIHALADTRITGLPGGAHVTSRDGVATVSLEAPSSYRFRATLDGYKPVDKEVYLDADSEAKIDQRRSSSWSVEASFFNALFLGGEAGYFLLPGTAFLKVGVTSYLLGLALTQQSLAYSFPLVDARAEIGYYWSPEDAGVRFYTAVGGFVRVVFIPDFPPRIDALSPGGFQLSLGLEIPIAGESRFFFEWIPMLYLSGYPDLFIDSLGPKDVPFGYAPLDIGALALANVRFGVRWVP